MSKDNEFLKQITELSIKVLKQRHVLRAAAHAASAACLDHTFKKILYSIQVLPQEYAAACVKDKLTRIDCAKSFIGEKDIHDLHYQMLLENAFLEGWGVLSQILLSFSGTCNSNVDRHCCRSYFMGPSKIP